MRVWVRAQEGLAVAESGKMDMFGDLGGERMRV